jgi:hypothetical protein
MRNRSRIDRANLSNFVTDMFSTTMRVPSHSIGD